MARSITRKQKEQIVELFCSGCHILQIAKIVGTCEANVVRHLENKMLYGFRFDNPSKSGKDKRWVG